MVSRDRSGPDQPALDNCSICGLTYDLAWGSYSLAFGKSVTSAYAWRTAADYLRWITNGGVGGGALAIETGGFVRVASALLDLANHGTGAAGY